MALRDKLNSLAATATNKANSAIENGRLALRISNEERKISELTQNMGELLLDALDAGETFNDEIMALYSSIASARDSIACAKAEMDANRQSEEVIDTTVIVSSACEVCGTELIENANFCPKCGTKAEEDSVPSCPSCGAAIPEDANFCTQCGARLTPTEESNTEKPSGE